MSTGQLQIVKVLQIYGICVDGFYGLGKLFPKIHPLFYSFIPKSPPYRYPWYGYSTRPVALWNMHTLGSNKSHYSMKVCAIIITLECVVSHPLNVHVLDIRDIATLIKAVTTRVEA